MSPVFKLGTGENRAEKRDAVSRGVLPTYVRAASDFFNRDTFLVFFLRRQSNISVSPGGGVPDARGESSRKPS
jgi:hypothetical protein